ncbi:triphosphoribosyl-dephospho-CoA synthase [Ancylobacter pratisalsi]|uniref:Triphosphoribosyl-dephospho-CoA synthase n=1 Tax=Ancylobacter pratisalsi TaxID=1745854 RepID=A0A6P1YR09_9HYPH|nr:triphosphoribosyl-dephospho-CoA synthase [Ancylobacter pratisalsi]QIB35126.1 triphosphoribosyl-dephospho-CoA synthase [Ancylobacter pratisalsi]
MKAAHIAAAFRAACRAELDALKAGNVHRFSGGHGMDVGHFETAADAAAPYIAAPGERVGARIEEAVFASFAATGLNTNLGIVLLCAPLAAAAERGGALRDELRAVLAGLDLADAQAAFRAIARANPGGLGRAKAHDVSTPATIGLVQAMALAAERDRIACQYVTGFADIFERGLPRLEALADARPQAQAEATHLGFMAAFPDSHIARKFGPAVAETVREEAAALLAFVDFHAPEAVRHPPLLAFDASLKRRGLNPGTSADLTVATLFAHGLMAGQAHAMKRAISAGERRPS